MNQLDRQRVSVLIQNKTNHVLPLEANIIEECINLSVQASQEKLEYPLAVNIRIVDHNEGLILNKKYRKRNQPTNVLTFEGNLDQERNLDIELPFLGDIVICLPVVIQESRDQHKNLSAHFMHMLIHGFLHLLGFDHKKKDDETIMQSIENKVIEQSDIPIWSK
ncbi:MAG TPA: rRNA maturation RNase YbeY [Gammaproteobacteria bacterium]|jgi:probable rRNA maturation factor|nr:rRNA maturation RNase YbeY [Gammaproteobacteria bacterium]|tara:strand:+ start:56 stop:547 length:492 start_codon:yes stop_codon:yes gene_type:complete